MDQESVTLRYFLARALGEFRVDEGTDALLKAATTNRDPREAMVRRGALQALAVRAYNLSQLDPPRTLADPNVEPTLFKLAADENPLVRSETAYVLGQLGTPTALAELEKMVGDPHADTRYNAAIALAQHGNLAAIPTLAEMLDPDEMSSIREEPSVPAQFYKRSLIVTNALKEVDHLHARESGRRLHAGDGSPRKNHRRRPRRARKSAVPSDDRPAGRGDAEITSKSGSRLSRLRPRDSVSVIPFRQPSRATFHVEFRQQLLLSGNVSADNYKDLNFFKHP